MIRSLLTIDRPIGRGQFSDVYAIRHRYMGMQALKVLRDGRTESAREDGLREAFTLSKLTCPSIVRVFDCGMLPKSLGGSPYITMEWIGGGTLHAMAAGFMTLELNAVYDIAHQLIGALREAHRMSPPILHRDIKPSNVLIERRSDSSWRACIGDFGLAVPLDVNLGLVPAAGTLAYRAPESFAGYEMPASDVYSLGLVLYELATGVMPVLLLLEGVNVGDDSRVRELLSGSLATQIEPLTHYRHAIHPAFDAMVMRCLAPDVSDRFCDAVDLMRFMECVLWAVKRDPEPSTSTREALAIARRGEFVTQSAEMLERATDADSKLRATYSPMIRYLRGTEGPVP